MPFAMFAFFMLFPIVMIGLGLGIAVWSKIVARTMKQARPVEVSDLAAGYGVVWGRVEEGNLKAPLSGRRCAWYEAWVEELRPPPRNQDRGVHASPDWERVSLDSSDQPIRVTDGKATCLVVPEGARVHETAWSSWEGSAERPGRDGTEPDLNAGTYTPPTLRVTSTMSSVFGDSPVRYRYVERYIMAGDPIFAMGEAEPRRRGGKRQGAEASAPAAFRIRKPDTRRPFVISAQEPSAIYAENQLAASGGLVLAVMGAVGAVVLWNLRYG
ncbi:E3 ubiquitin ligase family protein [Neoroseomonas rubea]|uniref:E3 ubiquitin ligase family protein n=1 Tax=Neoroseomonas rubea TaxID=2748666 RepID=UPI001E415AF0|nr:E3 ubiquitin ligase family protein [Roseomonas rubea]